MPTTMMPAMMASTTQVSFEAGRGVGSACAGSGCGAMRGSGAAPAGDVISVLMSVGISVWISGWLRPSGERVSVGLSGLGCVLFAVTAPMKQREHGGNKDEGGDGGETESTDNGAAERSVLLAAFAEAHSHGNHTDDHGEGRHEDGTEACGAGVDGGADGIAGF